MLKVVCDTNIFISAILFGGKPELIIRHSKSKKIEILVSQDILAELSGILKRKFHWNDLQIMHAADSIRRNTTLITPKQTINIIKKHDPDNRILECAVEGNASYIISGDKNHLQPLNEYRGIKIISPSKFLKEFVII